VVWITVNDFSFKHHHQRLIDGPALRPFVRKTMVITGNGDTAERNKVNPYA